MVHETKVVHLKNSNHGSKPVHIDFEIMYAKFLKFTSKARDFKHISTLGLRNKNGKTKRLKNKESQD